MDSKLVFKTVAGVIPSNKKSEIRPKNRLEKEPRLMKEERELSKNIPAISLTSRVSATRIRTPNMTVTDNSNLNFTYKSSMFIKPQESMKKSASFTSENF